MKMYEPLPLRNFTQDQRIKWLDLYTEFLQKMPMGTGHKISVTDKKAYCACLVCRSIAPVEKAGQ